MAKVCAPLIELILTLRLLSLGMIHAGDKCTCPSPRPAGQHDRRTRHAAPLDWTALIVEQRIPTSFSTGDSFVKNLACLLVLSLLALPVFAATPLQLPSPLPPLRIPQAAHPQPRPTAGLPVLAWTPQLIESLNLSSTVTLDLLARLPKVAHAGMATLITPTWTDAIAAGRNTAPYRRITPLA